MTRSWVIGLGLLGIVGCAVETIEANESDDEAYEGEVAPAAEALLGGWASGPYTWGQGQVRRTLQPFSSDICVLTRVSGKFEGDGEWVRVWHDGSRWYLGGDSRQHGVGAEATCFPRSGITAIGSRSGVSSEFEAWSRGVSRCTTVGLDTWWGDAATVLSGLKGKMAGGGEWVGIDQSPGAFTPSQLLSSSCATYLTAYGHAFWFGSASSGRLAKFIGPYGVRGDVYQAGEFVASGNGSAVMARTSQAICYFTRVQGGFRGGAEVAQIRSEWIGGVEYWVLRTGKGGGSDYVGASARCYARDQR